MIANLDFLKARFEEFNRLVFAGRLPMPLLTLCDATSFVAQYKSKLRELPGGHKEPCGHQIRFSTAFNLDEREMEDTLVHEMIHYFIAYNGLRDRTAHGPLFKALMQAVNEAHGRNISISHRTSASELGKAREVKKKWHVVAILHFTSGQLGVKVLPRVIPKIIDYYKGISAASNIAKVELFLHNDPFFNRFPTSVGRRCQAISEEERKLHLAGAHILEVNGGKLVQR